MTCDDSHSLESLKIINAQPKMEESKRFFGASIPCHFHVLDYVFGDQDYFFLLYYKLKIMSLPSMSLGGSFIFQKKYSHFSSMRVYALQ